MQGMSTTREPRAISDRLRPEMIHALRRGSAEHPSTRTGLVARRLVSPGSTVRDLRLTPMGRQWSKMLGCMETMIATLRDAGNLLDGEHFTGQDQARVRDAVEACESKLRGMVWP